MKLRLYQGAASSLYGGWEQEARGKEVTINTGISFLKYCFREQEARGKEVTINTGTSFHENSTQALVFIFNPTLNPT